MCILYIGGMSDRGYSSMTLYDAKRASMVIGSQDSIDSLPKKWEKKDSDKISPPINKTKITKHRPGEKCDDKGRIIQVFFLFQLS